MERAPETRHRMPFVRANDLTVHYDLAGPAGAPVVMFANSLGTSLQVWDPQAAALAVSCRVLRYDNRGHGLTDCPHGAYPVEWMAGDALAPLHVPGLCGVHV